MKILQNEIMCNKCGDKIYSRSRHDFKDCKCGEVSVDGGTDYLRRCGLDYTDISITLNDDLYQDCMEAFQWSKDNKRNDFGTLCALFRTFRKHNYKLVKYE